LKFAGSTSESLVGAGCALLLVCTLASAQINNQISKTASAASKKPAAKSETTTAHPTSRKGKKSRRRAASAANWRHRGQQKIDPKRAREIQEALIREHYLKEEASGVWDDASPKAMERYQTDHGWQSKMVPDARALIRLGLGPDHEHLLNPESAMTTQPQPQPPPSAPVSAPAPSTDPASDNQPHR
jgi:hypothetical protein